MEHATTNYAGSHGPQIYKYRVPARPGSVQAHKRFKAELHNLTAAKDGSIMPFFIGARDHFSFTKARDSPDVMQANSRWLTDAFLV